MAFDVFDLMPPAERVRWRDIPRIWLSDREDPRLTVDIGRLIVTAIPILVVVFIPPFILAYAESFDDFVSKTFDGSVMRTVAFVAAGLLLIVGLTLLCYKAYFRWRIASFDIHKDFKILQYVFLAHVESEAKITYACRFLVRARREGISKFTATFNWTGDGRVKARKRMRNHTITQKDHVIGNFGRVEIDLGRTLNKGDPEQIDYYLETTAEEGHTALPYIGIAVSCHKYPFFNTHMIVSFTPDAKPVVLYREYFYSVLMDRAFRSDPIQLNKNDLHRWRVSTVVNWRYCIRWDYGAE